MAKKDASTGEDYSGLSATELVVALNKKYGSNTLVLASEATGIEINHIATGSHALDFALGGGFPQNRIIEIRGPFSSFKSTISLCSTRNFQRKYPDGFGVYIDVEKTFGTKYAAKLGVDLDRLILVNPDSGEQGVNVINDVMKWEVPLWIVIDSVAALVPSAELDAQMEQQLMGQHARLIARMMRVVTSRMKRNLYSAEAPSTTVLALNQLRQKIGVMFGCMSGNTRVLLSDGSSMQIRHIVNKRLPVEVLCFDERTEQITSAKVIDWHINGTVPDSSGFIRFDIEGFGGSGIQHFACTPNHKVLTPKGWKAADTLRVGDSVYSQVPSKLCAMSRQILLASHLADGCLDIRARNTACLKLQNSEQPDYLKWKLDKLSFLGFRKNAKRWDSYYSAELALQRKEFENCPNLFSKLSPLGLAVWFMDDGHHKACHKTGNIAFSRFPANYTRQAVRTLNQRFNLGCSFSKAQANIYFSVSAFRKLCALIAPYVPPCMDYKLLPEFRGKYSDFTLKGRTGRIRIEAKVVAIKPFANWFKNKRKYDITVQGHHNYLVGGNHNGVIVHNSPETTPGGMAKDFFYSTIVRLHASVSKAAVIAKEETRNKIKHNVRYGQSIDFKVLKNKCGGPQGEEGSFEYYEREYEGHPANTFDNVAALFRYGAFNDVITFDDSSGYQYRGLKAKRENHFIELLEDNQKLQRALYREIVQKLRTTPEEE